MKSIADRNLMRDYLLGKLDEQTELEDKLSDDILNNNNEEISDIVDSIEDQIIEGYLEGTLNLADTDAVDKYFLQPPQRREKLRFAQILKHYFERHVRRLGSGYHIDSDIRKWYSPEPQSS